MTTENFKLEKVRDFGQLFTDTFLFIKYNYKNILRGMFYYVLPFGLLHGVVLGLLQYETLLPITSGNSFETDYSSSVIIYSTIASYFFLLLSYTVTMAFMMEYIKLYRDKGANNFELNEVGKAMLADIPKILGALILAGIIIVLGLILLVIPGIYISICVSLVIPIIVFEEESVGDAISGCFNLIKNNWWNVFAFLFVMGLVSSALNFAFQLPSTIYTMVTAIFASTGDTMTISKSITILFSIFQALGYALIQILPLTAIALVYFNLIERRQSPALLKDLETVGKDE
ncbi:hypothetical protein [Marinifilum caeruleilacunae]|uniref:Glycerophosphoryl diester phosphodiesterase membrane domain-containing protein n=1 Tax=Marinifilum caeruleilacunae TaxID=2499076 RepID=A0ABX1WT42_9BACT|nr:hypothetical protein [Marinifilum caeruleilacunae]NOU59166.1 hypothetical protein [Marinifilum caeruleilacunae]